MKNYINYSKYDEILNIPYRVTGERKWRWMEGFVKYERDSDGNKDSGSKNLIVLYDPELDELITTRHNVEILIIKDIEAMEFIISIGVIQRTNNIVIKGVIRFLRVGSNTISYADLMGLFCYGNISRLFSNRTLIGCLRVSPENIKAILAPNFLISIIDFPRIASKEGVNIELQEPDGDQWTPTTPTT